MAFVDDSKGYTASAGGARVEDYVALLKPRVMSLVVFTAIIGLLPAPGGVNPVIGVIARSRTAMSTDYTDYTD